MEALRTRIDTLQWELNQLRVENWRLKEENPEASRLVTLEAELEGARGDVARLTERVSVGEREVTSERTRADTASRTQEEEAIKLSDTQEQLRAATTQLESARGHSKQDAGGRSDKTERYAGAAASGDHATRIGDGTAGERADQVAVSPVRLCILAFSLVFMAHLSNAVVSGKSLFFSGSHSSEAAAIAYRPPRSVDTHTDRQNDYHNPRYACAPRVSYNYEKRPYRSH